MRAYFFLQNVIITFFIIAYFLEDDEDGERGISPRGDFLSKELDYDAADDGYSSLYMPGWIKCNSYEVSGSIYALENELEKGKNILKEALLNTLDKEIIHLQKMKTVIEKGKVLEIFLILFSILKN